MQASLISTPMNWDKVMIESDYIIATTLRQIYDMGNPEELKKGLDALIHNALISSKLDLRRDLKGLMENILRWKYSVGEPCEAEERTQERRELIYHYRSEIELSLECDGCLSEQSIRDEWDSAFIWAVDIASIYIPKVVDVKEMTWEEVFDTHY